MVMRVAVVSDIHANLQAWNAVLLDCGSMKVDRMICLGDIVGYGPDPAAVLESVYKHAQDVILGNHDAAVCGKLDENLFNAGAASIVRWTRQQLNTQAMGFLKTLPLTLCGPGFRCSHGDFSNPGAFEYVIDAQDALPSWQAVPESLLFVGHSHIPGIYLLGESGRPHRVDAQDFSVEPGKRFLVNVGSAGQPRDGDSRAGYCIYDSDSKSVFWRRIPFDLDGFRQRIQEAGLDPSISGFLRADPRATLPPVRELLSFSPAQSEDQQVSDAVEVAELASLQVAVRRWKRFVALTVLCLLLAAGSGGSLLWYEMSRAATIIPAGWVDVHGQIPPVGPSNMLGFPGAPLSTPQAITGWKVDLGDRRQQRVSWDPTHEDGCLVLQSKSDQNSIRIESPGFAVAQGMRFRLEAMTRNSPDTTGMAGTDITLIREIDGSPVRVTHFGGKVPNMPRREGWMLAQETFTIPAGGISIHIGLQAKFEGQIAVKDLRLIRVE